MKNTRNKVRLTESQLHNVIKESVKQVLTELDWKTYQNAAKKAHLIALDDIDDRDNEAYQKMLSKSARFRRAAEDAFNRDYGTDNTKLRSDMHGASKRAPGGGYFPYNDDSSVHMTTPNGEYFDYNPHGGFTKKLNDEWGYKSSEYRDEWDKATDELQNYKRGNYEYQKGKGWQKKDGLDESIRRAIRKVLH